MARFARRGHPSLQSVAIGFRGDTPLQGHRRYFALDMTARQHDGILRASLVAACVVGVCACLLSLLRARATEFYPDTNAPGFPMAAPAPVHHMRGWPHGPAGS